MALQKREVLSCEAAHHQGYREADRDPGQFLMTVESGHSWSCGRQADSQEETGYRIDTEERSALVLSDSPRLDGRC